MFAKIALTVAFLIVMVGIGVYSRRHSRSVDGFVLGGRSVGPWLTAFAFGTSYFSAVVFVGYAGQFGWKYGLASTWIGVGNAVVGSLLAWLVLARRTRLMTQRIRSRTMPDFFGTRYGSERLRVAASIIAFVFLIPYTAGVYMGISKLFELGFGSAVPYEFWAITMATLTAAYVILGGYKATAINDFIQGLVMLAGITAVILLVVNHQGGLSAAVGKLAEAKPDAYDLSMRGKELYANFRPGDFASWFGPAPLSLLGVVILTSLGTWGLPQMVGKFYSITDESAIRRGTVISTVFAIVVAGGCYFIGGFGRLFVKTAFDPGKGRLAFDAIVPQMLSGLPEALMALVMLLVLSASMSTLASLVLTSSSTMTLDLIYRDKKSEEGEVAAGQIDDAVAAQIERRKVVVMRVLIVFFIVISLLIALRPPQFIAQLMGISWGALAGAFLAPFLYGLYWRGVTRAAVWASFAWGVGLTVVNMLLGNPMNPIDCGAAAMLGSLAVVPAVSLVTPRLPRSLVDSVFGRGEAEKGAAE
ncbi:MAG: sodium:solute symporter [Kiritimatiellae bacterium]|nr:sodium:solute symporter [Kiritimatiellia bacterium]